MDIKRKLRKKDQETTIFTPLFLIIIFIITGLLAFSNWQMFQKRKSLDLRVKTLHQEVQELEARNKELEEGLAESEKEEFWEERIRKQGYQKPGETAVVIKKEPVPEKENVSEPQIPGFWEQILAEISGVLKR